MPLQPLRESCSSRNPSVFEGLPCGWRVSKMQSLSETSGRAELVQAGEALLALVPLRLGFFLLLPVQGG